MKFFCMAYSEALGCYNFYIVESNWAIGVGEKKTTMNGKYMRHTFFFREKITCIVW